MRCIHCGELPQNHARDGGCPQLFRYTRGEAKRGKQTWWGSIVEAKANIAFGAVVAYVSNLVILPAAGLQGLTTVNNAEIVFWFTLVSVVRQLVVRRLFNNFKWGHHK